MSTHQPDVGAVPAGAPQSGRPDEPSPDLRDRSLPELVKQLSDQTTTLLRKEIEGLVGRLATIDGLDLTLTTNASLLARKAQALRDAGLLRTELGDGGLRANLADL